jgi:ribosome biogenesis GTPase / thiamine phosphate phosphatase
MSSIDFDRLRPIGFTLLLAQHFTALQLPAARCARVVEIHREHVRLDDGETCLDASLRLSLRHALAAEADALAVGDWVACVDGAIVARLPSATRIQRLSPEGHLKVLVANVDVALLVMGLDSDFNPRRIERYLALVQSAGVWPIVVLSKADVAADPQSALDALRDRLPCDLAIEAVNGCDPSAAAALLPYLSAGQTAVLLGSSGAGKSTLTNTLLGKAVQDTGEVREADGRGQHTTTTRTLFRLANGACLIDTPGLRGLRADIDEDALAASFSDITALAESCRFRDCRHHEEPGCAVREAISADRLANWRKLLREARRDQMTLLERRQLLSLWKQRSRGAAERMKMKRGG